MPIAIAGDSLPEARQMLTTFTTADHRKVSVAKHPARIATSHHPPDAPIIAQIRERMARVKAAKRRA